MHILFLIQQLLAFLLPFETVTYLLRTCNLCSKAAKKVLQTMWGPLKDRTVYPRWDYSTIDDAVSSKFPGVWLFDFSMFFFGESIVTVVFVEVDWYTQGILLCCKWASIAHQRAALVVIDHDMADDLGHIPSSPLPADILLHSNNPARLVSTFGGDITFTVGGFHWLDMIQPELTVQFIHATRQVTWSDDFFAQHSESSIPGRNKAESDLLESWGLGSHQSMSWCMKSIILLILWCILLQEPAWWEFLVPQTSILSHQIARFVHFTLPGNYSQTYPTDK